MRNNTYHRTANAVVLSHSIMRAASAIDWRVLHAIEFHAGYKTWRCRLSLKRIAKTALCSRKRAGMSCQWWAEMGAVKITRTGKASIFEVLRDFSPSPERVHRKRHITQKRDPKGKFAPQTAHQSPPQTAHQSPPCTAYGSEREVFNKKSLTNKRVVSDSAPEGSSPPPLEKQNLIEGKKNRTEEISTLVSALVRTKRKPLCGEKEMAEALEKLRS